MNIGIVYSFTLDYTAIWKISRNAEYTSGEANLLKCNDIAAGYGSLSPAVIADLSLEFTSGGLTALVGPNGCGKSTLLKAMMGLLPFQSGMVILNGEKIHNLPRRQRARRIAYLPQNTHCPDYMSVGELVDLGGYARRGMFGRATFEQKREFQAALKTVGLSDMAQTQMNALSGGQRQRAWIAMILAQAADAILLDEPVNHLDLRYQIAVLELVQKIAKQRNRVVICVLHDLNLAANFADHIVMLDQGRIVAKGSVGHALTADTIRSAYGVEVDVFERNTRRICTPLGLAE